MDNDILKAKHNVGDAHPSKPLVWTEYKPGKFDWRPAPKGAGGQKPAAPQSNGDATNTDKKPDAQGKGNKPASTQTTPAAGGGGKSLSDMSHDELVNYAKQLATPKLVDVVNSTNIDKNARKIAFAELKTRNDFDASKVTATDISIPKTAKVQYKQKPNVDIDVPDSWIVQKNGKRKTVTAAEVRKTYEGLSDDQLLTILNSKTIKDINRLQIAYEEAAARGIDESKIKVSPNLTSHWDRQEQISKIKNKPQTSNDDDDDDEGEIVDINTRGVDFSKLDEQFPDGDEGWRDPNDKRVSSFFNGYRTLTDRQRYDEYVNNKKRQDPDYVPALEQIQDLNAEYLDFLDGDASSFLISAGGAGVGKTWGFKKLCELLNLQPFSPKTKNNPNGMNPGDADYDWVVAPNIKSEKQLNEFLAAHNGKIILFDDNDAILTRQDMKAVMKTVNDNDPDSRLFKDPETGQMIKFTGKIACITNKSLDSLSEDEDGKAVLSRAKKLEVKMTVEENLEILADRYKDMKIDGLDLGDDEDKWREEVYKFILQNRDRLDPAKFTVRKFRDIMLDVQSSIRRKSFSGTSALAAKLVGTGRDWKKTALASLNKANDDEMNKEDEEEFGEQRPTKRLKKKIDELKKKNPKLAKQLFGDSAADNFESKEDFDTDNKAEKAVIDELSNSMTIDEAENILFS